MSAEDPREVVIVGGGPAGLTAAIYAARAELRPLVLEGEHVSVSEQPGGQLMSTTDVENFPGFPAGIQGPQLVAALQEQATRFGAELVPEAVREVDLDAHPFRIFTDEDEHRARALIVATGAHALMLGLDGETRLLGNGVSTCATCDGFFCRGQPIAVVGGGDSAVEEAIFLSRFAERVTLVHRRDRLRAAKILQQRLDSHANVEVRYDSEVAELEGQESLEAAILRDMRSGERTRLPVQGLFVAIGHRPNTRLFAGRLATDEHGYIQTHDGTRTSVPGVFACGDIQDPSYRQAITAAGSGCMAALDAERFLEWLPFAAISEKGAT